MIDGIFTGNVISGLNTPDVNGDGIPDGKDFDIDGDLLTVTSFQVGNKANLQTFNPGDTFTTPLGSFITISDSGDISGDGKANDLPPIIIYSISDGHGGTAIGSV